nr:MAG TPA: hypothetical protein [Caudoviricetes sp.]
MSQAEKGAINRGRNHNESHSRAWRRFDDQI